MSLTSRPLQLYSAQPCPFAQRTRLVLIAKGLEFEINEIDLDHPPEDFRRLSPYGKVPLLVHGETRIWESTVINEYLDESFPQPALMPGPPAERAWARIWMDHANNHFVPLYYKLLLATERERREAMAQRLVQALQFIEELGLSHNHTYWMGKAPGLVDFAFYPFFERFGVLAHYRNFAIPASCARLAAWLQAMAEVPAVLHCAQRPEFYIERYAHYADGTIGSDTAREMREK